MSSSSKHYILVPLGTFGDVNPFLWIGRLLRTRGHEVTFISCTAFKTPLEAIDFNHFPVGDRSESEAVLNNPRFWHPWHGVRILFTFSGAWTERIFFSIRACLRSDMENVIVAPATVFGARLAREKLGIPLGTIHLQPSAIHSTYETPSMGYGIEWMAGVYWVWKRFFPYLPTPIDFYAGPSIRRACKVQQICYPKRILNQWWHSPDGILCLFPNWFAKPQPDWPTPWTQTTFPLYDADKNILIPSGLQKFLDSGSPPILFTLGSAMQHPGRFFEIAVQVSTLLKRRILLISPANISLPNPLPSHVFVCGSYVPFSRIFPKVEAVVHHGGVGTISQALAAGVPQLIMPRSFDQPDNAARLVKLGVAQLICSAQFTQKNVCANLDLLLNKPSIRFTCKALAERLFSEKSANRTLAFLENLTRRSCRNS